MPAKTLELELIYRREKIRFDGSDVCILECEEIVKHEDAKDTKDVQINGTTIDLLEPWASGVTVKCEIPDSDPLHTGLSYRFYGHFSEHEKYGRQFQARTYVRCQPHGKAGVIRYLQTTCEGCGVGRATAQALWDKFQGDAVRILREQPEVAVAAAKMQHFTEEKAAAASAVLKQESALEAVSIDLIDLLGGRGFQRDTAKKCVQEWGNKSAELVRKNPYLLMRFRGAGFGLTDKLYLDLGGNPAALKRQALCAWHTLARDTEGHTWYTPGFVENGLRGKIGGAGLRPLDAMRLAKRAKALAVFTDERGVKWVAEFKKAKNESTIAEKVIEMLAEKSCWPEVGA